MFEKLARQDKTMAMSLRRYNTNSILHHFGSK